MVGLGYRLGALGETEEDVEGQVVRVRLRREDDASGQGLKYNGLDQTASKTTLPARASGVGSRAGTTPRGRSTSGSRSLSPTCRKSDVRDRSKGSATTPALPQSTDLAAREVA